jgi:hypothetical protein
MAGKKCLNELIIDYQVFISRKNPKIFLGKTKGFSILALVFPYICPLLSRLCFSSRTLFLNGLCQPDSGPGKEVVTAAACPACRQEPHGWPNTLFLPKIAGNTSYGRN